MDRDEAIRALRTGGDGVKIWNAFRAVDHWYGELQQIDLSGVDLTGVVFKAVNLERANFTNANLSLATFEGAGLHCAKLRDANLFRAEFHGSDLVETDFAGAKLQFASFESCGMTATNLGGAHSNRTRFSDLNLSETKGLDTISFAGLCLIDVETLIRSLGELPQHFLLGCGVPESLIAYLPSLIGSMSPIQFYSCFISYSAKDQKFAERLHADLQAKGVRTWFAPEDLPIGAKIRSELDSSIHIHEKLLLVLSEHSVSSDWRIRLRSSVV
jgi:hypothetical protein